MGQTLMHGVYLPDEGERNCYNGLAANWQLLDGAVGTVAANTAALAGKAPLVHTHSKADITDLLNSDFIPSANNSYNLGSSSYQWNNLYANNYYYNGTAWGLDKENVWTQIQEIRAASESTGLYFSSYHGQVEYNTCGTSNYKNYNCFLKMSSNRYDNTIGIYRSVGRLGDTEAGATLHDIDTSFAYYDIHIAAKYMQIMQNTQFINNDTVNQVIPSVTNTTDLGTSDNKWKTLNGINPGALSLPSSDSADYIDLSSNLSTNAEYLYTAPYDGWLCLYVNVNEFFEENAIGLYRSDSSANSHQWAKSVTTALNLYKQSRYQGSVMLPVESGKKYICYISLNANTTIHSKYLFFYKNKGNV